MSRTVAQKKGILMGLTLVVVVVLLTQMFMLPERIVLVWGRGGHC